MKIAGILIVALVVLGLASMHLLNTFFSDKGVRETIERNQIPFVEKTIPFGQHEIYAVRVGKPSKPKALLIHGSPGHWFDWEFVITNSELLENYCMISYDRPGFGGTTVPAREKLEDQAAVAAAVMREFCQATNDCYMIVGHSYGGAVAEEVLRNYPDLAEKGLYVAGTMSPKHQGLRWYNYLAAFKPISWLLPQDMRASNLEMMNLANDLSANTGLQENIHQPLVFIQGTEDVLVPFGTVSYYEAQKTDGIEFVIVEGLNHFIPWTNPELVVDAMLK